MVSLENAGSRRYIGVERKGRDKKTVCERLLKALRSFAFLCGSILQV
jgi:hypothetical protein